MSLSTTWPSALQFKKHKAEPITAAVMSGRQMAMNHFGAPEGVFLYRKDDITMQEYCCDLDMRKEKGPDGVERLLVVTMIYLCPRCGQSCCIHGPGSGRGDPREITVHWDRMQQSKEDGLWRPPLSVLGPLRCDYAWAEINGIVAPRLTDKCGWRGRIEEGKCYDDQKQALIVTR